MRVVAVTTRNLKEMQRGMRKRKMTAKKCSRKNSNKRTKRASAKSTKST